MNIDNTLKILELLKNNPSLRPTDLAQELQISRQALHRLLKKLVSDHKIKKKGQAPLVYYELIENRQVKLNLEKQIDEVSLAIIEKNFSRQLPTGELIKGIPAFESWLISTKQIKASKKLAVTYSELLSKLNKEKNFYGLINLTQKLQDTFDNINIIEVYCSDFYSIPQFGKTYLGNLITAGKSGQNLTAIQETVKLTEDHIQSLIKNFNIDALVWTPHSISRKILFLKEFKRILNLDLPEIKVDKVFTGNIPVAQKSLSKLEERVENARETLVLKNNKTAFKNILIIDDALGSGSTINEIAGKIARAYSIKNIYGYAVVGSFKGFDVISVV